MLSRLVNKRAMASRCQIGIPTLTEMLAGMGIPILTEIFRGPESKFPETEPYFLHTACVFRDQELSNARLQVAKT